MHGKLKPIFSIKLLSVRVDFLNEIIDDFWKFLTSQKWKIISNKTMYKKMLEVSYKL